METVQGALKNGRNVLDRINMPQAEFDSRVAKLREAMKKEKLDLLLIYGYGFDAYGDPAYVTNFITRLPRGALVALAAQGQPALFFDGSSRGIPSFRRTVSDADVIAVSDMVKDSVKYLKEKKLVPGRIGLAGLRELMPYAQFKALKEALADCVFVEANAAVADLRLLKTTREMDEIRRAGRIVHDIFESLPTFDFPALDEHTIMSYLYREARYEGAEDVRLMVGRSSGKGWYLRPAEKEAVRPGETVAFFLAAEFERYWAEAARTFRLENGAFVPAGEGLEAVYREASGLVKAGMTADALHGAIVKAAKAKGFDPIFDYGLGNGVGLSPEERPLIAAGDATRLAEGMALALWLVVRDKGMGGLMTGQTLLVTAGAPVLLT